MADIGSITDHVSGVVTAVAALVGLFFLGRQNGYLRRQLARPVPIFSIDAHAVAEWPDRRWRSITLSVHNPADVHLQVLAIEVLDVPTVQVWQLADVMVVSPSGGRVLSKVPPTGHGLAKLPLNMHVSPAANLTDAQVQRNHRNLVIRLDEPDQTLPKVRLTYRWKDMDATVIATVATIWDSDATA